MTWLDPGTFARRPIVYLEDQLYHMDELLRGVDRVRPDLLAATTACIVERPGPDTTRAVLAWLDRYPALQVAAVAPLAAPPDRAARLTVFGDAQLGESSSFARAVAALLRPGGVLVQDVHLSTLAFVPADRWWESIFIASTIRGMLRTRQPTVRFLSNKRGYSATFGRDLLEAGFDPRDVIDKAELLPTGVDAIGRLFDQAFPLALERRLGRGTAGDGTGPVRLADDEEERAEVDASHDLVLWDLDGRVELGGRLVSRTVLKPNGQEAATWRALVESSLCGSPGPGVTDVGARLAPADAERAEITNVAARHLHGLRSRLANAAAIVTRDHAYWLAADLDVGRVRRHLPAPSVSHRSVT